MVSILGGGLPPLSVQDMLENSARLVDKFLQDDRNFLDLSELLQIPSQSQPNLSGLHDYDYPNLQEAGFGFQEKLPELAPIKRLPLPQELTEQFDRMQCNCMMGLFPEIQRAYLTIDSDIFVWKYEDGSDLAYFDGLSETILSVALVRPKAGIFEPHIQQLLCLATPVDIVLLGVSFANFSNGGSGDSDPSTGEMHLLPEPLYSIPTDGIFITTITGTTNGRIFMAGKDGALYELIYQAQEGWFSRKCRKVCHSSSTLSFLIPSFLSFTFSKDDPLVQISIDNSRHVLYGRTQKGSIQVYDLGRDGTGMGRVVSVSEKAILDQATHIARTVEKSYFKTIVHISALTMAESLNLHLVAVTQSGVRLFFSTAPFNTEFTGPSTLVLNHVRLPPGFSAHSNRPPSDVHTAFSRQGTLLLLSSQDEDSDLLWAVSSDSFPFQKQLMEAQMKLPINGRTWALAELRLEDDEADQQPAPPAVVTQHLELPRHFIVLTTQGCTIFRKLRPREHLQLLLADCGTYEAEEVRAFFRLHRLDQACATCLAVAFSKNHGDSQVANWARMAFLMYGGEAQYNLSTASSGTVGGNLSSSVMYSPSSAALGMAPMTPMPGMVPAHMSTPMPYSSSLHQSAVGPVPGSLPEVLYSGKHNGIYIYLARILRPLWYTPVAAELRCETPQGTAVYLTSTYSSEELRLTLEYIRDLSDFVEFSSKFDSSSASDLSSLSPVHVPARMRFMEMDEHTRKKLQGEAQRVEKLSLQHVQELLQRVAEVLGLWSVLLDHQFHTLTALLSDDQLNQLRSLTFKTLVVSGKDVCMGLITSLINRYLSDNATVDAISSRLREVCPSLYSSDDAICSKADELLQLARITQNPNEQRAHLVESLRLLKSVTTRLTLGVACSRLVQCHFYTGIVDLCLAEAQKRDPHNLAQHFYTHGEQPEDTQGMQAYIARMECYRCITDMLGHLWGVASAPAATPSRPKAPGPPPPTPEPSQLTGEQAEQYKDEVLQLALKSTDMLFHAALCDWLFTTNRSEKLLEVNSPYLEAYLQHRASQTDDKVAALDMLWKFYERNNNFTAAARILSQLSQRHGTDVNLQQRIEYLSRAIMCAKSATSIGGTTASGEFLHELEEKMEVARLQLQVLTCLKHPGELPTGMTNLDLQEAQSQLQADLVDITTLYENFADRFDLWECKLAIVYCAGLYDSALIENLWQNIINKELAVLRGNNKDHKLMTVSERLVGIMTNYVSAERYFPPAFILRQLEEKSCELGLENRRWVYLVLMEIGLPPLKLLELYDRLFKSKNPVWQTMGRPHHLLSVIQSLLLHLVQNPSLIPPQERRRFSVVGLDYVASYLVELQATRADGTIHQLIAQFRGVQAMLERF